MWIKFLIFLGQYAIFWSEHEFANANPIIGQNVSPVPGNSNRYNFIVSIMRITENPNPTEDHQCMGSLITNRDVLTNEHCLEFEELNFIQILVGSIHLNAGRRYFPLWFKTYDQWCLENARTQEYEINDISIIRLTRNVTNDIIPVRLSTKSPSQLYGLNAEMLGWGISNTGQIPNTMETITLTIIPNDTCERIALQLEGIYIPLHTRMFCTIARPFALMQFGDSGGPLMENNQIIAVNGGTFPRPDEDVHPQKVNLHFTIHYYTSFILHVLQNY